MKLALSLVLILVGYSSAAVRRKPPKQVKCLKQQDLGGQCKTHFECYGLSICRFGSCVCPDGFVERFIKTGRDSSIHRTVCALGPLNGEECILSRCGPFLKCNNERQVCECKNGTRPFGSYCFPDCESGKIFANGRCLQVSKIGEVCETNDQCWTAYSKCHKGKCACISGTIRNKDDECEPEPKCPFGDPVRESNKTVICKPTSRGRSSPLQGLGQISPASIFERPIVPDFDKGLPVQQPWYAILEQSATSYSLNLAAGGGPSDASERQPKKPTPVDESSLLKAMVSELLKDDPEALRNPTELFGALFRGYGAAGLKLNELLLGPESELASFVNADPYYIVKRLLETENSENLLNTDSEEEDDDNAALEKELRKALAHKRVSLNGKAAKSGSKAPLDVIAQTVPKSGLPSNPFVDVLRLLFEVPKELRKLSIASREASREARRRESSAKEQKSSEEEIEKEIEEKKEGAAKENKDSRVEKNVEVTVAPGNSSESVGSNLNETAADLVTSEIPSVKLTEFVDAMAPDTRQIFELLTSHPKILRSLLKDLKIVDNNFVVPGVPTDTKTRADYYPSVHGNSAGVTVEENVDAVKSKPDEALSTFGRHSAIVPNIVGGFGKWIRGSVPYERRLSKNGSVDDAAPVRRFPAAEFNIFSMLPSADYSTILSLIEDVAAPCDFVKALRDSAILTAGAGSDESEEVAADASKTLSKTESKAVDEKTDLGSETAIPKANASRQRVPFTANEVSNEFNSLARIVIPGTTNFSHGNDGSSIIDVDFFVIENGYAAAERTYYGASAETQLATSFIYALMYHLHELPFFLKTHFPGRVLDTLYLLDQMWSPLTELKDVLNDVYIATLGEEVSEFVNKGKTKVSDSIREEDSKRILRRLFGPSVTLTGSNGLYSKVQTIAHGILPIEKDVDANEGTEVPPTGFGNGIPGFGTPAKQGLLEVSKAKWAGSCPDEHRCISMESSTNEGVCCPEPSHFVKCPFGNKLKNAVCSPTLRQLQNKFLACPQDSHYCYRFTLNQHQGDICCPRECPKSRPISVDGKCFPASSYLGRCYVKEQCDPRSVNGLKCLKYEDDEQNRCTCPDDSIFVLGICVKKCHSDEIPFRTQCLKKADPEDTCLIGNQCSKGSVCVHGICKCQPGSILVDGNCRRDTICPGVYGHGRPDPILEGPEGPEIKKCRPENQTNTCGDDGFCHPTSLTAGVCCPLPQPSCPFGGVPLRRSRDTPLKTCNRSSECGVGAICHQFWYTNHGSRVCCPLPKFFSGK